MNEIKLCPFCGSKVEMKNAVIYPNMERSPASIRCKKCNFFIADYEDDDLIQHWNNRPIEDVMLKRAEKAEARVQELESENNWLSGLLHDELSQLEIATDLGNKRWKALNKIYTDGEKHNTNWCKRKAGEGLGINDD